MSTINNDAYTTLRKIPKITVSDENKFIRTLDDVFVDLNIKLSEKENLRGQVISRIKRRILGRIDKVSVDSLIAELNETFQGKRKYSVEYIDRQPSDPTELQLLYQCIDSKFTDNTRRDDAGKWNVIKGYLPMRITVDAPEIKATLLSFACADVAKKYVHEDSPASFNVSKSAKGNYKVWDFRSFISYNIVLAQAYTFSINKGEADHKVLLAKSIATRSSFKYETDGKFLRFGERDYDRILLISDFSKLPKGFNATSKGNAIILSESFSEQNLSMFFNGYYGALLQKNGLDLSKYFVMHSQSVKNASYYERDSVITPIAPADMAKLNQIISSLTLKLAKFLEDFGYQVFIFKKDMVTLTQGTVFYSNMSRVLSYRKESIDDSVFKSLTDNGTVFSTDLTKFFKAEGIANKNDLISKFDALRVKNHIAGSAMFVARKGIEISMVANELLLKSVSDMMVQSYNLTEMERIVHTTRIFEFVEYRVSEIQFAWEELRDIGERARSHEDTKVFTEAKQSYLEKVKAGGVIKLTKVEDIAKKSIETALSKLFSDVELDIDTDLVLYDKFEKEVVSFVNRVKIIPKKNRFKVRKLGNHKALGLYYPSQKTLVVDVSSPSSFIHEFGHLMDHEIGDLSLCNDFSDIVKKTISILEERMNKLPVGDKMKSALSGDSKYNFEYFIRPREIFARAFETHCALNLGLVNSIMETQKYYSSEFAYIADKEYLNEIGKYFSSHFPK